MAIKISHTFVLYLDEDDLIPAYKRNVGVLCKDINLDCPICCFKKEIQEQILLTPIVIYKDNKKDRSNKTNYLVIKSRY